MRQRVSLESPAIVAVTYDDGNRTLDVEFREEHSYRYMHVPEFVYRALLNAGVGGSVLECSKESIRAREIRLKN
jgi:hypothetical protein